MSAFMVSKVHIDLLVDVAVNGSREGRWRYGNPVRWWIRRPQDGKAPETKSADADQADGIGLLLADQNARSVRYRYADLDAAQIIPDWFGFGRYKWQRPVYRLTALEALSAINCYEYQACETPDYDGTEAKLFCEALRGKLIRNLPGYDGLPWEWTPERVKERLQAVAGLR